LGLPINIIAIMLRFLDSGVVMETGIHQKELALDEIFFLSAVNNDQNPTTRITAK